jgi:hypothetical protein
MPAYLFETAEGESRSNDAFRQINYMLPCVRAATKLEGLP